MNAHEAQGRSMIRGTSVWPPIEPLVSTGVGRRKSLTGYDKGTVYSRPWTGFYRTRGVTSGVTGGSVHGGGTRKRST